MEISIERSPNTDVWAWHWTHNPSDPELNALDHLATAPYFEAKVKISFR